MREMGKREIHENSTQPRKKELKMKKRVEPRTKSSKGMAN